MALIAQVRGNRGRVRLHNSPHKRRRYPPCHRSCNLHTRSGDHLSLSTAKMKAV
jgi:hypothetical protein